MIILELEIRSRGNRKLLTWNRCRPHILIQQLAKLLIWCKPLSISFLVCKIGNSEMWEILVDKWMESVSSGKKQALVKCSPLLVFLFIFLASRPLLPRLCHWVAHRHGFGPLVSYFVVLL